MGGQACVFYGAAEFSRDLDLLILAEAANIESLRRALAELRAEHIWIKGTHYTSDVGTKKPLAFG
jgi:hypothetical protein